MAYYFKGAQILAPYTIVSNQPIYETESVSLAKQRASQGVQRWEISFDTLATADNEADLLLGVIENLATADTMVMPQLPSVEKGTDASTQLTLTLGAAVGDTSARVTSDGFVKKGAFFKFSNHTKLYMLTSEIEVSESVDQVTGVITRTDLEQSFTFYPPLKTTITTAHTMDTGADAQFSYYRDIDNQAGITFQDGILSSTGAVSLIEAIV
jgi:hypothetical protein